MAQPMANPARCALESGQRKRAVRDRHAPQPVIQTDPQPAHSGRVSATKMSGDIAMKM
jgi:hypothetical protein